MGSQVRVLPGAPFPRLNRRGGRLRLDLAESLHHGSGEVNLLQSPSRAKRHRRLKARELIMLVLPLIVAIGFVALVVVTINGATSVRTEWLWRR